jgi:hypothetical protein
LIVEFSLENRKALEIKQKRIEKAKVSVKVEILHERLLPYTEIFMRCNYFAVRPLTLSLPQGFEVHLYPGPTPGIKRARQRPTLLRK